MKGQSRNWESRRLKSRRGNRVRTTRLRTTDGGMASVVLSLVHETKNRSLFRPSLSVNLKKNTLSLTIFQTLVVGGWPPSVETSGGKERFSEVWPEQW